MLQALRDWWNCDQSDVSMDARHKGIFALVSPGQSTPPENEAIVQKYKRRVKTLAYYNEGYAEHRILQVLLEGIVSALNSVDARRNVGKLGSGRFRIFKPANFMPQKCLQS